MLDDTDTQTCRQALLWIRRQRELHRLPADPAIARALNALDVSEAGREPIAVEEDWISAAEAAKLLGLSPRQTRRRATELGARKAGHAWIFPKGRL